MSALQSHYPQSVISTPRGLEVWPYFLEWNNATQEPLQTRYEGPYKLLKVRSTRPVSGLFRQAEAFLLEGIHHWEKE